MTPLTSKSSQPNRAARRRERAREMRALLTDVARLAVVHPCATCGAMFDTHDPSCVAARAARWLIEHKADES